MGRGGRFTDTHVFHPREASVATQLRLHDMEENDSDVSFVQVARQASAATYHSPEREERRSRGSCVLYTNMYGSVSLAVPM